MKYDVVALGELLIDFTSSELSEQGNLQFEANPGGAPANVLAMLTKLNKKTAFIGKVGADMFGELLIQTLQKLNVCTKGIISTNDIPTTLAFVKNSEDGEREFFFYRKPGADTQLQASELDSEMLKNCSIFHFGSLSLTHQPAQTATNKAVTIAKKEGAIISFDPNLRPLLWNDLQEAKKQIEWGCSKCDILKIAEEELLFLSEEKTVEQGIVALQNKFPHIKLLFVTKGKQGASAVWGNIQIHSEAFTHVKTIDTTGAGDTFCASCLSHVLSLNLDLPNEEKLADMLQFANAAAALVTTKKGALCSMPTQEEIYTLILDKEK